LAIFAAIRRAVPHDEAGRRFFDSPMAAGGGGTSLLGDVSQFDLGRMGPDGLRVLILAFATK
jgi:hypothetical protein